MTLAWSQSLILLVFAIGIIWTGLSAFNTPSVYARSSSSTQALAKSCVKTQFFGLEPWWQYLGSELDNGSGGGSKCDVKCFNLTDTGSAHNKCGQSRSDVPLVLLAVVDDLLRIAAIVAIGYVMYGAFQFVTSQGDSDGAARARTTVISALVGLTLSTTAVAIVSFLGKKLGG